SSLIEAAFLDGDFDELKTNSDAVVTALDELKALSAHLLDKVGSQAPELDALTAELQLMRRVLSEQLARRTGTPVDDALGGDAAGSAGGAGAGAAAAPGDIRTREDAIRMLDRICD